MALIPMPYLEEEKQFNRSAFRVGINPVGGWTVNERDNNNLVITVDKRIGCVVFDSESEDEVVIRVVPKDR